MWSIRRRLDMRCSSWSGADPSVPLARARLTVEHLLVMVADFGRNAGGQVKLSRNASAARLSASHGACHPPMESRAAGLGPICPTHHAPGAQTGLWRWISERR